MAAAGGSGGGDDWGFFGPLGGGFDDKRYTSGGGGFFGPLGGDGSGNSNRYNRLQSDSAEEVNNLRGVVTLPGDGGRRMFEARIHLPAQTGNSGREVVRLGRYSRARAAAIAHDVFQVFLHHDTTVNFPELLHIYHMRTPRRTIDHHGAQVPVTQEDVDRIRNIARRLNQTECPDAAFQHSEEGNIDSTNSGTLPSRRPSAPCAHVPPNWPSTDQPLVPASTWHRPMVPSSGPNDRLSVGPVRRRMSRADTSNSPFAGRRNLLQQRAVQPSNSPFAVQPRRQSAPSRYPEEPFGQPAAYGREPSLLDLLYDSANTSAQRQMPQNYGGNSSSFTAPGRRESASGLIRPTSPNERNMQLVLNRPYTKEFLQGSSCQQQGYGDDYYGDGGHYNYQDIQRIAQLQRQQHPREPLNFDMRARRSTPNSSIGLGLAEGRARTLEANAAASAGLGPFVRQRSPMATAIDGTRYPSLFFGLTRMPSPSTFDQSRAPLDPNRSSPPLPSASLDLNRYPDPPSSPAQIGHLDLNKSPPHSSSDQNANGTL